MKSNTPRRLVVVADDFGKSSSVNSAVAEAHEKGVLTSASIMTGGGAFEEALRIARGSALSVGLHITLCDGHAVLPPASIPGLAGPDGLLLRSPSLAWIRYSRTFLLDQIDREIGAQFEKLTAHGIRPTHVDSHHHLHMHPSIFPLVCRHALRHGVTWIRIPREGFSTVAALSSRGPRAFVEWSLFGLLGVHHRRCLRKQGLRSADSVLGLSATGHLDERRMLQLTARTEGLTEIFLHPDTGTISGRRELQALLSPALRTVLASRRITLAGYGELGDGKR